MAGQSLDKIWSNHGIDELMHFPAIIQFNCWDNDKCHYCNGTKPDHREGCCVSVALKAAEDVNPQRATVMAFDEAIRWYDRMIRMMPPQQRDIWKDKAHPFLDRYGFFDAPASIKYHLNTKHGLLRHSVAVTKNALDLNQLWYGYPAWKVIWAGLFHDIGKIGAVDFETGKHTPRYVEDDEWEPAIVGARKSGWFIDKPDLGFQSLHNFHSKNTYPYKYNTDSKEGQPDGVVYENLSVRNVIHACHVFPNIPADVLQAIQMADGHYVPMNETYQHKCHPLAYLIHTADWHTGAIQEKGWIKALHDGGTKTTEA